MLVTVTELVLRHTLACLTVMHQARFHTLAKWVSLKLEAVPACSEPAEHVHSA